MRKHGKSLTYFVIAEVIITAPSFYFYVMMFQGTLFDPVDLSRGNRQN